MKIQTIKWQHRRDFSADMICEKCGNIEKDVGGYDDDHFHRNVIPDMECIKCGEKAGDDYRPLATKYAANEEV